MANCFLSRCRLSGTALKLIAAASMLIDHIGVVLFPEVTALRIVGRISFPIFAFMIAEGCIHTRNRLRYFLTVFLLGAGCQLVYFLYDGSRYLGVLITFSLSILLIFALQSLKNILFSEQSSGAECCFAAAGFLAAVGSVYLLNRLLHIDYGFWGCMLPVSAALLRKPAKNAPAVWEKLDRPAYHVLMLGLCLLMLAYSLRDYQIWSMLALPPLLLYSGKRGKWDLKYFFYIFYPLHLAILEGITILT